MVALKMLNDEYLTRNDLFQILQNGGLLHALISWLCYYQLTGLLSADWGLTTVIVVSVAAVRGQPEYILLVRVTAATAAAFSSKETAKNIK